VKNVRKEVGFENFSALNSLKGLNRKLCNIISVCEPLKQFFNQLGDELHVNTKEKILQSVSHD
jgi:hypothetical protein